MRAVPEKFIKARKYALAVFIAVSPRSGLSEFWDMSNGRVKSKIKKI